MKEKRVEIGFFNLSLPMLTVVMMEVAQDVLQKDPNYEFLEEILW